MKKPVLVIMAAGMGSRYGGLKQIDPMDEWGNPIIDFSIFDAKRAGFEEVVFIIKHEIEEEFKKAIGEHISKYMKVSYAFQQLEMLPEGFTVPEGRTKPWGTTHAIYCAKDVVGDRPFAVINADDYYGPEAFRVLYDFLTTNDDPNCHTLVGYLVENTLTEHGSVSRGVCTVDDNGNLTNIVERLKIFKRPDKIEFTEDDGETFTQIEEGTYVSMNCWGFKPSLFEGLGEVLKRDLPEGIKNNPMKFEAVLPGAVQSLMAGGKASVKVLSTTDRWFGITYKEDKPMVVQSIKDLKAKGVYTEKLWS
ncbi:MAG: nucleotidyltransferase [Clostridia bacterium]|nr:nucleotidyltransferase [Clostridia bacterium]